MWTAMGPDIEWKKIVTLSHRDVIAALQAHTNRFPGDPKLRGEKHCRSCVRKIEEDISVVDRLSEVVADD